MRLSYTDKFKKQLSKTTPRLQKAFAKQAELLLRQANYPSLDTKLYDKNAGLWQARVNRSWRFYFTIDGDTYTLVAITEHP